MLYCKYINSKNVFLRIFLEFFSFYFSIKNFSITFGFVFLLLFIVCLVEFFFSFFSIPVATLTMMIKCFKNILFCLHFTLMVAAVLRHRSHSCNHCCLFPIEWKSILVSGACKIIKYICMCERIFQKFIFSIFKSLCSKFYENHKYRQYS